MIQSFLFFSFAIITHLFYQSFRHSNRWRHAENI